MFTARTRRLHSERKEYGSSTSGTPTFCSLMGAFLSCIFLHPLPYVPINSPRSRNAARASLYLDRSVTVPSPLSFPSAATSMVIAAISPASSHVAAKAWRLATNRDTVLTAPRMLCSSPPWGNAATPGRGW